MLRFFGIFLCCVLFQVAGPRHWDSAIAGELKRLPDDVTPTRYQLNLDVNPRLERFSGLAVIDVDLAASRNVIELHGQGLNVSHAEVRLADGTLVAATYEEDGESGYATLRLPRAVGPGAVQLKLTYSAAFNTSYVGLYKVERDGISYAYTHFQPLRARRMFPGFDEPRFKTPFEMRVTAQQSDKVVSNGPERNVVDLGDGKRRHEFQLTKPIPTYLVALAVGDFDVVEWAAMPANAVRSRTVALRGITAKGKGDKIRYALKHTAAMVDILETYFAIPYPYAKLDLIAAAGFNSGGMENVGAIIYREDRILLGKSPSIYQRRGFAGIHAHELAHMWFGNYVTPAWWDDLWLNEAFATWMSSKVTHAWRPEVYSSRGSVRRANQAKWTDRRAGAPQIRNPIRNEEDVARAFGDITYSKGGGVLSMIEQYVGPVAFRDGVRRFMKDHAHGVATAEDFLSALAVSGDAPELKTAFRSFVEQPGTPLVSVDWTCNTDASVTVRLDQSRSLPLGSTGNSDRLWTIPLCLAWAESGARQSQCTTLTKKRTQLRLNTASCPAAILPNKNGAAYVNFALPARGWDELIRTLPDLPPAEALVMLRSLQSAYEAGQVDTKVVVRASRAAAGSKHWDVVEAPMQNLRHMKLFVVPKSDRKAVLGLLRDIYRPQLAKVDTSDAALAVAPETVSGALSRARLLWFLANDAEDPGLSKLLTRRAHAFLGYKTDGKVHPDALHPNLHRAAIYAGLRVTGMPFAEALIVHLKATKDSVLRAHIVRALAQSANPDVVRRVWSLILDPEISKYDASQLLRRQGQKIDNTPALFDWLMANYAHVLKRIPKSHHRWMPWRASGFCDRVNRARVEAFFSGPGKIKRSGPKVLQNVLEDIDLCIAFSEAQRPGALEVIAAYK